MLIYQCLSAELGFQSLVAMREEVRSDKEKAAGEYKLVPTRMISHGGLRFGFNLMISLMA